MLRRVRVTISITRGHVYNVSTNTETTNDACIRYANVTNGKKLSLSGGSCYLTGYARYLEQRWAWLTSYDSTSGHAESPRRRHRCSWSINITSSSAPPAAAAAVGARHCAATVPIPTRSCAADFWHVTSL